LLPENPCSYDEPIGYRPPPYLPSCRTARARRIRHVRPPLHLGEGPGVRVPYPAHPNAWPPRTRKSPILSEAKSRCAGVQFPISNAWSHGLTHSTTPPLTSRTSNTFNPDFHMSTLGPVCSSGFVVARMAVPHMGPAHSSLISLQRFGIDPAATQLHAIQMVKIFVSRDQLTVQHMRCRRDPHVILSHRVSRLYDLRRVMVNLSVCLDNLRCIDVDGDKRSHQFVQFRTTILSPFAFSGKGHRWSIHLRDGGKEFLIALLGRQLAPDRHQPAALLLLTCERLEIQFAACGAGTLAKNRSPERCGVRASASMRSKLPDGR